MHKTAERQAVLRLDSTWGTVQVEARGGRITSCSLPALRAEPGQSFHWKAAHFSSESAEDRAVLISARLYILSLFKGRPGKPPLFDWPVLLIFKGAPTLASGGYAPGSVQAP